MENSMQKLISIFYQHNLWANQNLFDTCLTLNDEQLNHTDPGAYGSIQKTLQHLVRAEERYLYHLVRWEPAVPMNLDDQPAIAELKERVHTTGKKLLEIATTTDPDKTIQVGDGDDADHMPAWVILLQVIHHAHEHRTQVNTLLGQLEIEIPSGSGWGYYFEEILKE
jgi:uncharacterized damage-inducible protein DinB